MTREQDSPRTTITLAKGLSLLSMFDLNHPEWTFTELWKRTGIPRTTAIRLLDTLEESGYVQFDIATGKYYLGPAMFRSAYLMLSPLQLGRVARPHLEQLQEETKETVGFAVLVHGQPVVVEIVHTSRPYKMNLPGLPLLDISSCYQRVFLAYSSNEQRAKAFENGITPRTPYTRTDPREITQVLDRIKDEGVAISENEVIVGSGSVAAPVFLVSGQICATVGVVAPIERFGLAEKSTLAAAVRTTAARITDVLSQQESAGCPLSFDH